MTTLEMEIAIMSWLNPRANTVVPNVSWGLNIHECDILSLTKAGYATEVEIKISKADLLKDFQKRHGHSNDKIKYFWYAVPEKLKEIALEVIPARAGLLVISKHEPSWNVTRVRPAKATGKYKWTEQERQKLQRLGALRILGLKKKLAKFVRKNDD